MNGTQGAFRGGYNNVLITDEDAARKVLLRLDRIPVKTVN
ncbi:MAG TPA: sugar-binding domain-containing protein [Bacillota bacterium]|nr:hypothetical protein [Bacillota bacterium]HOA36094.1 sugar-binding domain-containing protein [Bacillota bacterium]HOJ84720.1 sugar-binding domain-containing protein [Bacillota bacterium]HOL16232.1 sugar-binding domain-containing protein [Bacillota bacterium]HPZ10898.1 sugar-binding domain-containing protein [Bacillota bacterium]